MRVFLSHVRVSFIKSLSGPCGPQTRSCPPLPNPLLVIYLNLCDFNEIGSLLASRTQSIGRDSTLPTIHKSIKDVFQFDFIFLHFVCLLFTLHTLFFVVPVAAAAASAAVGHQKCQAINKSISRLSGISVICMKICARLSFTIS